MIVRLGREGRMSRFYMSLRYTIPSLNQRYTFKIPSKRCFSTSTAQLSNVRSYTMPFQSSKEMARINTLTSSKRKTHELLNKIVVGDLSTKDVERIHHLFYSSLNIAPTELEGDKTFFLACDIWDSAFKNYKGFTRLTKLQRALLSKRKLFVNSLLHFKYHEIYESIVAPLLQTTDPIPREWCDTLIETIRFRYSRNRSLIYDSEAIGSFIKSSVNTIDEKRVLLSVFVRKGLFDNKNEDDVFTIIKSFIRFISMSEDKHLLLTKFEHRQYRAAVFLLIEHLQKTTEPLLKIESAFKYLDQGVFFNFISTIIKVSSERLPTTTEKYFEYKLRNGLNYTTSDDLTNMMVAFHSNRQFDQVFEISKKLPQFYHEDQLVVLLKVSESLNDWKTLQSQFNEMYGQGHLPYAVHYSIVMKALASIGAKEEVDRLFSQLKKRKITPSASIYAALIKSRVINKEYEGAKEIFEEYLSFRENIKELDLQTSDLYRLIVEVYLKNNDNNEMLNFINETLKRQKEEGVQLIDSYTITQYITYFVESFSFKDVKYIHKIAEELDLLTEDVYAQLVNAYTMFSQYELAEELLVEAHNYSLAPFRNPKLLKAQLRNYRIWFGHRNNHGIKEYIWNARNQLIDVVVSEKTSSYSKASLYSEMVKHFISRKMVAHAKNYIQRANVFKATESSYLPVLKYYSESSNMAHHEKVLGLYKEMVNLNVEIGVRSYEYLLKSVVFMDSSKNDFHNSDKLFESILNKHDINITIPSKIAKDEVEEIESKAIKADLSGSADILCRIVSNYLITRPALQADKADFFVKFVTEVRERLNNQMKYSLRITIYKEMGRLYLNFHNLSVAHSLISNGIKEMEQIIKDYRAEFPLADKQIVNPRILENDYSTLINLRLKLLESSNADPASYLRVLNTSKELDVKLRGNDLNLILEKLLKLDPEKGLEPIMFLIEEYLSSGTIHEQNFRDRMLTLYCKFILEKCQVMPVSSIEHQYKLYNQFYGIEDIEELKASNSKHTRKTLKGLLNEFNKTYYKVGNYTYDYMMKNPELFFSPEKRMTTAYKIEPHLMTTVRNYILSYCHEDPIKIFQLTDKYPAAVESAMFNDIFKHKLEYFRHEINKIISPPSNVTETFVQRRSRTTRALKRLFGKDEFNNKNKDFFENDDYNEEM